MPKTYKFFENLIFNRSKKSSKPCTQRPKHKIYPHFVARFLNPVAGSWPSAKGQGNFGVASRPLGAPLSEVGHICAELFLCTMDMFDLFSYPKHSPFPGSGSSGIGSTCQRSQQGLRRGQLQLRRPRRYEGSISGLFLTFGTSSSIVYALRHSFKGWIKISYVHNDDKRCPVLPCPSAAHYFGTGEPASSISKSQPLPIVLSNLNPLALFVPES